MSYGLKEFRTDLIAHPFPERAPLAPAIKYKPADEATVAPLDLPQKLALLQMSRRHSNQAIWFEIKKTYEAPPFTLATFRALRELKLCELLPGQRFHSLTTSGAQCADLIGRQLQRQHDIHAAWLGGHEGPLTTLHCTCGWSCGLRRGDGMQLKAARSMTTHLRTVEAMDGLKTMLAPLKSGVARG